MSFFTNFLRDLPMYILSLPVLLMAFSVHESAHGYAALKLGDPTARNLGRITLNPVKHLDLLGTVCMLLAHVGWAKPVPINARNFKNPKRDMAVTGAAGPVSNLCLSIIHLIVLRVAMIFITPAVEEEAFRFLSAYFEGESFRGSLGFTVIALVVYLLYLGVVMNISLAIFNLIPIPPFDGSRIFYAFLPTKWYFGIMKYERIIMIVFLVLFYVGSLSGYLGIALNWVAGGLFDLVGLSDRLPWVNGSMMDILMTYVGQLLG